MSNLVSVNTAGIAVGHNGTRIRTGSIGSCVVIALYDEEAGVGGLAHAMLPSRPQKDQKSPASVPPAPDIEAPAKYADEAVDRLILEVGKIGGRKEKLKAKLIGGGSMFKILSGDKFGIGRQNIESARKRLAELGIPIAGEDLGGNMGRVVEFNLENGLIEVLTRL